MTALLTITLIVVLFLSGPVWGQHWQQLYEQATDDFNQGNYAQAIATLSPFLPAAKSAYEESMADTTYAKTLYLLGDCHWWAGNYAETEQLFKEYLSLIRSQQGEKNKAYSDRTADLAALYYDLGRYQEAEVLYKQSLDIDKEITNRDEEDYIGTLNNLAVLYDAMGRYEWAEPLYKKVIIGYRQLIGTAHSSYATALSNLSALYSSMGRYEAAEPLLKEAAKIHLANHGENNRSYATTLNNIAMTYVSLNRSEEALPYLLQSLEIKKRLVGETHSEYLISLSNLSHVYLVANNPEKAAETAEKAVKACLTSLGSQHPSYLNALSNQAAAYMRMGLYVQVEPWLEQVVNTRKEMLGTHHPDYAYALSNLAAVYTRNHDYQKAETTLIAALNHYRKHIQSFFPGLSEVEKEKYLINIQDYFESFHSFVLLRGDENESLIGLQYNNQLVTKALLLDASRKIRHNILASRDTALIRQFEQWQAQREQLAKYYQLQLEEHEKQSILLDSLETIANALEKELSTKSSVFAQANRQATWQDIKQVLKPGEAALEMVRFRKYHFDLGGNFTDTIYYAALIITPDVQYPRLILLEHGNLLEDRLLSAYRTDILEGRHDSDAYRYYWQPLQSALQGVKKLYFSPDGVFHQINLSSLYNLDSGWYLLDALQIVTLTSTRDLLEQKQQPLAVADAQAILIGYPDYDLRQEKRRQLKATVSIATVPTDQRPVKLERGNDLKPLPGTRQEVEQIAELLDKHNIKTTVYLGEQALEEAVKQVRNPTILHIATHGYFEQDVQLWKVHQNPLLRSGLFLAGAGRSLQDTITFDPLDTDPLDDGILTAYEAANLDLDHTELVVLSACETGLGEIRNGEGVYGLQRALKMAGATSLVMSLWKIDDNATQALMTSFYDHWLRVHDKAEAFKLAQQQFRRQYADPYYWGAFVMIGQ